MLMATMFFEFFMPTMCWVAPEIPPTGTGEALAAKHAIAAAKAHVDFGLYGLLGEDTIAQVPALVDGGDDVARLRCGPCCAVAPP